MYVKLYVCVSCVLFFHLLYYLGLSSSYTYFSLTSHIQILEDTHRQNIGSIV